MTLKTASWVNGIGCAAVAAGCCALVAKPLIITIPFALACGAWGVYGFRWLKGE